MESLSSSRPINLLPATGALGGSRCSCCSPHLFINSCQLRLSLICSLFMICAFLKKGENNHQENPDTLLECDSHTINNRKLMCFWFLFCFLLGFFGVFYWFNLSKEDCEEVWSGCVFAFHICLELAFPCFSASKIRPAAALSNIFSLRNIHFLSESVKFPWRAEIFW